MSRINSSEAPLGRVDGDVARGASVYTPATLALYDRFVLGFSNSWAWRCPSSQILDLYNHHVAARHLDIGVGTGYFLDRCRFPSASPTIALLDLNQHCLATTARRLQRYAPSTHVRDVLRPIHLGPSRFDSIGLNYLLHCLPGNLASKSVVFRNIKLLLNEGGVVFGSTILGSGVPRNLIARGLMKLYNARGIFCNSLDRREDLEAGLRAHFSKYTIRVVGCVAIFTASSFREAALASTELIR